MRMHADQVDVSVAAVERLVADQFPQWRQLPVRPVRSHGTVNALFRLGEDIVLRFPLQPRLGARHRAELVREQALARQIAPQVPLAVPEPLGLGEPGEGYAGPWTAYRWIEGEPGEPGDDHRRERVRLRPGRFRRGVSGHADRQVRAGTAPPAAAR